MKTLLVAALLLSPVLAHAQTKESIYVDCDAASGDDIGQALCSSVRDVITKSPRYALLPFPGKEYHYVIDIVSEGDPRGASAASVVFGVVFVGGGEVHLLGHAGIFTGRDKVSAQAARLLVNLDSLIASILKKP